MTSDVIKDGTKRFSAGEKMANSDKAAREIIAKEKTQREAKSDRPWRARAERRKPKKATPMQKARKPGSRARQLLLVNPLRFLSAFSLGASDSREAKLVVRKRIITGDILRSQLPPRGTYSLDEVLQIGNAATPPIMPAI